MDGPWFTEWMTNPSATTWTRRWTPDRLAGLRAQLSTQSRIVARPHTLVTEWPESEEGRLDLRGLPSGREGLQFRYITLSRVDFSRARGRLMFFESELSDCLFDSATLSGQPRFNRGFERCSFRGAALGGLAIGTRVVDCDFTGADLHTVRSLPNTRFERCTFDGAELRGAEFADTTFVDCTFVDVGVSASTAFIRCAFVGTSITVGLARLTRSTLDSIPLPDQWEGEKAWEEGLDAYVARYSAAAAAGAAADLALDPEGDR